MNTVRDALQSSRERIVQARSVMASGTVALLVGLACAGVDGREYFYLSDYPERRFAAVEWDTVSTAGSSSVSDTTLLRQCCAKLWGGDLIVADGANLDIRLIRAGVVQWAYNRKGSGPGELSGITGGTMISGEDRLWIHDYGNQKLLEFARDGSLYREVPVQSLPHAPGAMGWGGGLTSCTQPTPQMNG